MAAVGRCFPSGRAAIGAVVIAVCLGGVTPYCRASGLNETPLDAGALAQMEVQADHAKPQDQCYLYTELLHGMTELAGRQMTAGDDDAASQTIAHMDAIVVKIQATRKDKKLRDAEELLNHTSRRLADMVKVASGQERDVMQKALKQLDRVHSSVLAMVFQQ